MLFSTLLGVVLFETLTGERLFRGRDERETMYQILEANPSSIRSRLSGYPPKVVDCIEGAVQPCRSKRFESIVALAQALQELPVADLAVSSHGAGPRKTRKSSLLGAVAASSLLAFALGLAKPSSTLDHELAPPGAASQRSTVAHPVAPVVESLADSSGIVAPSFELTTSAASTTPTQQPAARNSQTLYQARRSPPVATRPSPSAVPAASPSAGILPFERTNPYRAAAPATILAGSR